MTEYRNVATGPSDKNDQHAEQARKAANHVQAHGESLPRAGSELARSKRGNRSDADKHIPTRINSVEFTIDRLVTPQERVENKRRTLPACDALTRELEAYATFKTPQ